MSDTTTTVDGSAVGRPPPRRRLATEIAVAGLITGLLAGLAILVAGPAGMPASAATPHCPKVISPATPRVEEPRPGPGGGLPRAAEVAHAPPARERCRRPAADPDVIVPERVRPAPSRAAARPPASKPSVRRPGPRRSTGARTAWAPASAPSATAGPTPTPGPIDGYAGSAALPVGPPVDATPDPRSLVYSGLFGLLLAAIGLTMVGRRRRGW